MSDFFESIKQGMNEALQYSKGKCPEAVVHKFSPLDVKNIVRELERLKFNIDSLSKEEIFNWLDDLIAFYSGKS